MTLEIEKKDGIEDHLKFVDWLKENKMYNEHDSDVSMRKMYSIWKKLQTPQSKAVQVKVVNLACVLCPITLEHRMAKECNNCDYFQGVEVVYNGAESNLIINCEGKKR